MPQYDESFILDDNTNQRRNKRSYRVSRKGLLPNGAVDGHGTYVLRNNINNQLNNARNDDRFIISAIDARDVFVKNNNCYGKSLEDLASDGKKQNGFFSRGKSLQNLNENIKVPFFSKYTNEKKPKEAPEPVEKSRSRRLYESNAKLKERAAIRLAARFLESGVYRQIGKAKCEDNDDSGFVDDGAEDGIVGGTTPTNVNSGSGHKASFRSANKLARRARSFKEDILERISAMRSPGMPSNNTALPSLRSQSPLSPKGRSQSKTDNPESNPAKDLEILVRQIQFDLKHFSDVITKKKLEMLPGNGTIVLDTITNINNVIKPHISPLSDSPSEALNTAQNRLNNAVADLIRLCDESMILGEDCKALKVANVQQITAEVQNAVENLASIAYEKMSGKVAPPKTNGNGAADAKNLKLQIRPAAEGIRNNTSEGQRNSLPDIPLSPRERQILESSGNGVSIRTSHSTESILDAGTPHQEQPPPKPPIPVRSFDVAPPLPPKRRTNDNSFVHLSTVDRVSLQSHSTGSLDSMLNVSNDEEIRAIMDRNSVNLDDSLQNASMDDKNHMGYPNCTSNRLSQDSNSTIGTTSSTATSGQNRLSNELITQQIQFADFQKDVNQCTNHNRLSSESGFVSMRNTRGSDMSFTNINCTNQKYNLSFIDSTPTPGDMPVTLLGDLSLDLNSKFSSSSNVNISQLTNVVQQSSVKQSTKHVMTSNQFFEQNSKSMSSNESKFFSQSSSSNTAFEMQKSVKCTESSSFVTSQRNVSQVMTMEGSNMSSMDFSSSNTLNMNSETETNVSDVTDCAVPPTLPVKTRKQLKTNMQCAKSIDQGFSALGTSFDDQVVELRERMPSCAVHGQDMPMHRPHTLMGQVYPCGQPPPLPIKKKHMFQSVAYSVMAYMEMFGNCSHNPQNGDFLRHSLHEQHQHSAGHCLTSIQQLSSNPSLKSHSLFSQNGIQHHAFNQTGHGFSSTMLGYNHQQLTQSHTLHQFNISGNGMINHHDLSESSSPARSPKPSIDDSFRSDESSASSIYTNTSTPPIPPSPVPSALPPALPPKKTKMKQTPNHSPAKPPLSPKPGAVPLSGTISPTTPAPMSCGTPMSGRTSISPAPQFQFDPPSICIYTSSAVPEEDVWQKAPTSNKPGKFPVEEIDLEHRKSTNSSPSIRDESSLELKSDSEPDIILEMDVTSRIVWKTPGEDGPDIRGGNPDALVVQSLKPNKDFSYQEAFLTTYRTFVTPLELIKKLSRRHAFLARHGQNTKAREVQSLLTRIVGDLTITDLDDELLNIIMEFVYGLVKSNDLAMAKALRLHILEKYKNKQMILQQQQLLASGCAWAANVSARRDSILEPKAEAIAEQMTLLDADLFTKIPAPEALLWAQDQCEERSPNLTRFTEHFNKMSYWARSRILEQEEAKDREKYVTKFMKVMKYLRKMNNFNSFLALLSALDSAPIRRLDWQKHITDGLKEYSALIDSSSSFRAYRQALGETQPPCIPYIGLVLQDLTFVHIGNNDLLEDGSINFSKRWQQYHILENMKRFSKAQYTFKKNERIIAMFNGFNDILNEEAMWQISESIRPRGGKKTNAS